MRARSATRDPPSARSNLSVTSRGKPKAGVGGTGKGHSTSTSSSDVEGGAHGRRTAEAAAAREAERNAALAAAAAAAEAAREHARWVAADKEVLVLLRVLGGAYRAIRRFEGREVLKLLGSFEWQVADQGRMPEKEGTRTGEWRENLEKVFDEREWGTASVRCLAARACHDLALYKEVSGRLRRGGAALRACQCAVDSHKTAVICIDPIASL